MSLFRKILNSPDEPAPVAEPNEQTTPTSPLGVDPAQPAPAAPVEAQESAAVPEAPAPKGPSYSQEEIDALTEKASRYDLFTNDPQLASKIADHYRAKTGITANEPVSASPSDIDDSQVSQEDPRMKELSQKIVQLELQQFHANHPDLSDYKEDVAALISNYNMPLAEAYKFAKAAKAQSSPQPVKDAPAVPTSEAGGSAGFDQDRDLDRAQVEKLINDPKATPHMDDAIDAALKYARKVASRNE